MILLIDNYDSFVYNLARYVSELGFASHVVRNDAVTLQDIIKLNPSHIIISPGPRAPQHAGISMNLIRYFGAHIPILGVCLGHQAIGQVYGAKVVRAKNPMHGKSSLITHDHSEIFAGLKNPLRVARYHSLIVSHEHFPEELEITARCDRGEIMAIRHRMHPVFGVQFHPESVLTEGGAVLLMNFMAVASAYRCEGATPNGIVTSDVVLTLEK